MLYFYLHHNSDGDKSITTKDTDNPGNSLKNIRCVIIASRHLGVLICFTPEKQISWLVVLTGLAPCSASLPTLLFFLLLNFSLPPSNHLSSPSCFLFPHCAFYLYSWCVWCASVGVCLFVSKVLSVLF